MPLVVSNDIEPLLELLPADIVAGLDGLTAQLSDIVLDKGRRPQAWCSGKRIFLCDGDDQRLVTPGDLESIVSQLGGFGTDNRAGLEAQLHRISAVRNRADSRRPRAPLRPRRDYPRNRDDRANQLQRRSPPRRGARPSR